MFEGIYDKQRNFLTHKQAVIFHNADWTLIVLNQFHTEMS